MTLCLKLVCLIELWLTGVIQKNSCSVRPSVRPSIRPSVRPSVRRPSVMPQISIERKMAQVVAGKLNISKKNG